TGPTRGPSVTSTWTRPLESVTTRGAPNRPFVADSTTSCPETGTPAVSRSSNRRGSGGCAPAAACWPTPSTNPLRQPDPGRQRRRRDQEEEQCYGRTHPDCSNRRSTESTPAYNA